MMITMLNELKEIAKPIKLLYVEDNPGLSKSINELLSGFFDNLFVAVDGQDGYHQFNEFNPDIIITDINMPKMDGLTMASKILKVDPSKKVIILSAHDEKEKLIESIRLGVFRFIQKPTKADELLLNLYETIIAINHNRNHYLYQKHVNDVFNYQNNLVMMLDKNYPVVINKRFLDFYSFEDRDEFSNHFHDLEGMLLEHQGFLYSMSNKKWLDVVLENLGRIYHTKMLDSNNEYHHFILKALRIPEHENHVVLSFNDITELDLMQIFDKSASSEDSRLRSKETAIKMLQVVKDNSAKLKIYNFYRGLSIINDAVIISVEEDKVVLKTQHSQLKIIEHVKHFTLSSEAFPESIFCQAVESINFDHQTVDFHNIQFVERSAANRKYTRLEVDKKSTATIIYREIKYPGNTKLIDISVNSACIGIDALPAGVKIDDELRVSFVLSASGTNPSSINTLATIIRVNETSNQYQVIIKFNASHHDQTKIENYLSLRQVELIKEFRKL